jgi:hypothetical protein
MINNPAVVQQAGGKVVWLKPKGPEHVVQEYWIYCWLGPNAFSEQKEIFDRVVTCSHQLGSVAIVWRRYASERRSVEEFRNKYLTGPVRIPIQDWNAHYRLLEEVVVDVQSFFWFSYRLLTNVALTLNFFFRKVSKLRVPKGDRIRSHETLVNSELLQQLPLELQAVAKELNEEVVRFRNGRVEHDVDFWSREEFKSVIEREGMTAVPEAAMHLEWSDRPLSEIWISLHDYLTGVAKFVGSQI